MKHLIFLFSTLISSTIHAAPILEATGFGTVNMETAVNQIQAKMMAQRAAKVDAQRQLSELVKGVQLTAGTTVQEYEVTSDLIATRVKSLLQGAFEINKSVQMESGSFSAVITLGICVDAEPDICKDRETLQSLVSQ